MRSFKKLGILVAVLALSAIGAASASAAQFTAHPAGELHGKALETQIFTTDSGQVKCATAAALGNTVTAATNQHVSVNYSGCTAFGLGGVHITTATFNFTANGVVHIVNPIVITSTLGGCTVTIKGGQSQGIVTFSNSGANNVKVTPHVSQIHYLGSGGLCGSKTLTNGTYTGVNEWEPIGGGQLRFDS